MAQPEEILRKQIDKIISERNLKDYDIDITPTSSEGANYMSINFKVKISSRNSPDLNLFAKVAQFSEAMRAQMPIDILYQREIMAYTQLLARYEELQEKYGIPIEDRYKFAKYYAGSSEFKEECIIMEDLVAQGHTLYDRFKPVAWDYAAKGVEEIAKFHALSLAFKHEYPNEYTDIFSKDEELFMPLLDTMVMSFKGMAQSTLSILPENLKERLEKFLEYQLSGDKIKDIFNSGKSGILCHGDYRASNVLFKRQGGKVKSFVPVDYQAVRVGSPVYDLLYFIYCGTDADLRRLHLKHLINHYYETFAKFLRLMNLDPEHEYSREDFDEEWKATLAQGLMTAVTVLPLVMVDVEDAPLTTSTEGGDMSSLAVLKVTDGYKKRFMPILNEFIGYGLL